MSTTFNDQIVSIMPKLRIQAMALTRNRAAADDLVQDAVCNALSAHSSFVPGTNFPAWMHRILRNRFISNSRKRREVTGIDHSSEETFALWPAHENCLALREVAQIIGLLPAKQREALLQVAIDGMSYEAIAEAAECPVGTAKSRVSRARRQLEAWLRDGTNHQIQSDTQIKSELRPDPTAQQRPD